MKRTLTIAVILFGGIVSVCYAADDPSIPKDVRLGVRSAIQEFIDGNSVNDEFVIYDAVAGELKRLKFKALHDGIVKKSDFYVSCADFVDAQDKAYDLDFLVADDGGIFLGVEGVVHSVGGEKRPYHLED